MKRTIYALLAVFAIIIFANSCNKDDVAAPIIEMYPYVDESNSYIWHFNTMSSDANSFIWDFGDGNSANGKEVSHTYTKSGKYTVIVTAKGDGGESSTTKEISIVASKEELLTGGTDATTGKTWVLSQASSNQNDGVYGVDGEVIQLAPGGALAMFGLGDEYDNEFTFFDGGKYTVNPKNGKTLASWSYAAMTSTAVAFSQETGLAVATFSAVNDGTYTLHTGNLTVDVRAEGSAKVETKVFEDATWLEFSKGAFFGINTFDTRVIIEELTANKMFVSILLSTQDPSNYPDDYSKPSNLYKFTYEAKK